MLGRSFGPVTPICLGLSQRQAEVFLPSSFLIHKKYSVLGLPRPSQPFCYRSWPLQKSQQSMLLNHFSLNVAEVDEMCEVTKKTTHESQTR